MHEKDTPLRERGAGIPSIRVAMRWGGSRPLAGCASLIDGWP